MVDASGIKSISETMLIPLMGRAVETQKGDGILNDPKSLEIYNRIDYDFDRLLDSSLDTSMTRTVVRTCIIDKLMKGYLEKYPAMTVVEMGCGLNTRYDRLDNGTLRWFDLDVPEVYPVWREFFVEGERNRFLPFSAFDEAWMKEVEEEGSTSYFFVSEASVIYFPEDMVKQLFLNLSRHFPGGYYLFDSANREFLDAMRSSSDPLKHCNAEMTWGLESVERLRDWVPDIEVIRTINIEDRENVFSHLYPGTFEGYKGGYFLNLVKI